MDFTLGLAIGLVIGYLARGFIAMWYFKRKVKRAKDLIAWSDEVQKQQAAMQNDM